MKWEKKGLIYCPDGSLDWAQNTFLTPTPIIIDENIRIYGGFRDEDGVSRIGYIDVDVQNPSKVINVSKKPVLDVGINGTFDDNGMILGDLIWVGNELRMYYVGFQKVNRVKFLAYSGLAVSSDGGENFTRVQQTPIMDRTENALYIRAIHTILKVDEKYLVWYSVGSGWEIINDIPYPKYDIRFTESKNGILFDDNKGVHCVGVRPNEYRIGRPRVRMTSGGFEMRYTYDTKEKFYGTGYAVSVDGRTWTRRDELTGIRTSETGWDSEMVCYPVTISVGKKEYMFYSGNGMGATGVGYAELLES